MTGKLSGQSVLVTGASAGIGRASVDALVAAGATVLATGRRQAELDALIARHGAASVQAMAGDLNDAGFVAALVARARDVDILVNNAGILTYAPVMDMSFDDTAAMFQTNVLASFRVLQAVARSMIERRRGHIIVMSSIAAREVRPAWRDLLRDQACAVRRSRAACGSSCEGFGIKVTEIAPGMVDTDIRATSGHPSVREAQKVRKFAPLTAEEVAEAVVYAAQSAPNCGTDLVELRPLGAA